MLGKRFNVPDQNQKFKESLDKTAISKINLLYKTPVLIIRYHLHEKMFSPQNLHIDHRNLSELSNKRRSLDRTVLRPVPVSKIDRAYIRLHHISILQVTSDTIMDKNV